MNELLIMLAAGFGIGLLFMLFVEVMSWSEEDEL